MNTWNFLQNSIGEKHVKKTKTRKTRSVPDPLYQSEVVAKFINKVMIGGKKSVARRIVYNAIEDFAKKVNTEDALEAFEQSP